MNRRCRVALLGDYNSSVVAHQAIPEALRLAGEELDVAAEGVWLHTSSLRSPKTQLAGFDGIWCVPASPYANAEGAIDAIRYARDSRVPFLGTCAGFQYAVIEYARNVLGMSTAGHAEDSPEGETLVITALACSLVEKSEEIVLAENSVVGAAYGEKRIQESYRCNYGLNPAFQERLISGELRATGAGATGEVRVLELANHPFFVGTLFQSERRALRGEAPPLVLAFLDAMSEKKLLQAEEL